MASKSAGSLTSPWTSNGFDGVFGQDHPTPLPLSKWTEFEGAARAAASRPPTNRGNHRFGSLSYNSFFSRHNPHPCRVTHLKGLLDMPICVVNDDGYFANPRYTLNFPPNDFNQAKINRWKTGGRNQSPGSSRTTPNISNGLQSKTTKKKYGNGAWRDMYSIPNNGAEAWRDELKMLTETLMKSSDHQNTCPAQHPNGNIPQSDRPVKKRSTQYSAETGRIIQSSSLSRGKLNSRKQRMKSSSAELENMIEKSSSEVLVLQLLCQILETEDINEVKKWLTTAADRERAFAFELLRMALSTSDEDEICQHQFHLLPSLTEEQHDHLPDLLPPVTSELDSLNKIDRLIIDHEVSEKNKNYPKTCNPTEAEQCLCMAQKSDGPIQMQNKLPKVSYYVKKTSVTTTEPKQNDMQKNLLASKAHGTRMSPSEEREETTDLISEKAQEGLQQSPDRPNCDQGDITQPGYALKRSYTVI